MTREEIGDYLEKLFDKKDFKRSTRDTYKRWLLKLHDFYSNKKMSELTFEDIEKYTKQLISRKLASPDSLKQLIFAVNFLYNTELNRNFKFYNIKIPEAKRKEKDYLTQEEVIRLIDFIPHKKQKAIITTIYACFLERKEVLNLKIGDEFFVDMFFDEENYGFKLKYLGKETISTDFGKVNTLIFRPYVLAGRVFKEEESLTLWVSDDKNKIPLRVKADLAVGSLRADLEAFKGLKYPFKIIVEN